MENSIAVGEHRLAASLYDRGSYGESLEIYRKLAENNDSDCQTFVGWMHHKGLGTTKDDEEALRWFKKAADLSNLEGMFYCGRLMTAMARHQEAFAWYEKAAANGYSAAHFRLALAYDRGQGVGVDKSKALEYMRMAAEKGHVLAKREIGIRLILRGRGFREKIIGLRTLFSILASARRITLENERSGELKW